MTTEAEKRLHRCCFSGHRPEKLREDEATVRLWLRARLLEAIDAGYHTFLTGMGMGADIWAGETVLSLKKDHPELHLIAAPPYPGFERRWHFEHQKAYRDLLARADLVRYVCPSFQNDAFRLRNEWLVRHSHRLIVYYNGEPGGTHEMLTLARSKGMECVVGGIPNAASDNA